MHLLQRLGWRSLLWLCASPHQFLRRFKFLAPCLLVVCLLPGCIGAQRNWLLQERRLQVDRGTIFDAPGLLPTQGVVVEPTPFSPLVSTPRLDLSITVEPTNQNIISPPQPDARSQSLPVVKNFNQSNDILTHEPTLDFYGIDFSNHQRVTITIYPLGKNINHGKPVKLSFIPGEHCQFGDKMGCVYAYKPTSQGNVIVITVHSGVGGEAQQFRGVLEGTGVNRAGYGLEKVKTNMNSLSGAQVIISQGENEVRQLQLAGVTRIPARSLARYFRAPLAEILSVAADINPQIGWLVYPEVPQIVIETCGWKMPGEQGVDRVTDTTGSIYLGIIR
jgi:hypothetical protein